MSKYKYRKRRMLYIPGRVWRLLAGLVILAVVGTVLTWHIYNNDLRPVSSNQASQLITIASGSSIKQIADSLYQAKLIRSAWAFQLYVHGEELNNDLQAGTYALSPSESTATIVSIITKGQVSSKLVTILPGKRIDQIRADLINDGFSPVSVDQALNPANYNDLPALAFKPSNVNTLEGLLWPDSWYKDSNTPPSYIIRESLLEMGQHLTPAVQAAFAAQGLTTYQGLILTSIVLQEVSKPSDQAQVAQVFLTRLHSGSMLGSDVTADYGAIEAGMLPSLTYDSPYNTLLHGGLPPSPISTIDMSALAAVTHPANTNWLYFVAGDDGTTYFSNTLQQQQANTQEYCHKLCGQ